MLDLFPFLSGQSIISNQEPVSGRTEFTRDSASAKVASSPFAGILKHQASAASLLFFQPLTTASGNQQHLSDRQKPLHQQELAGDVILQQSLVTALVAEGRMVNLPEEKGMFASLPLIGEEGEGVVGDGDFHQELSDLLPIHDFSKAQLLPGEKFLPAGFSGTENAGNLYLPPVFTSFDPSFFASRISVPGSPGEVTMPDAGFTPSVASPDRPLPVIDNVKGQFTIDGLPGGEGSNGSNDDTGRNSLQSLERTFKPLLETETPLPKSVPSLANDSREILRKAGHQAFQASSPIEESPEDIAEGVISYLYRVKPPPILSSFINSMPEQSKASSMSPLSDFLKDHHVSLTGEHTKNFSEATGKMVGVEQQAGQGLNTGLGGSPHSHQGFQQASPMLQNGSGVRMAEDRMTEFPTPALQRLQLDVQLSDTNRIQIDVGVQHRQVYAGLILDQASMKSLAVQYVPQLEDQLAQADMELQEFSAEVRDHHREQEADIDAHLGGKSEGQREFAARPAREPVSQVVRRLEERGFHLVA